MTSRPIDPTLLRTDLPAAWADVIQAALAFDPTMRPRSVRDFAELLIEGLPGGAELARAVSFQPVGGATLPVAPSDNAPPSAAVKTTLSTTSGETSKQAKATQRRWILIAVPSMFLLIGAAVAGRLVAPPQSSRAATAEATLPTPSTAKTTPALSSTASPNARDARLGNRGSVSRAVPTLDAGVADAARLATMRLETVPPGAQLFVNGKALGAAPQRLERPLGQRVMLRVEAPAHEPHAEELEVTAGSKRIVLKPAVTTPKKRQRRAQPSRKPAESGKGRTQRPADSKSPWQVPQDDDVFRVPKGERY